MEIKDEITISSGKGNKNPKHKFKQKYNKDILLSLLIEFVKENGRNPQARDFVKNPKYPHFSTFQREFGSWDNALIEAGIYIERSWTRDEIIESIKRFSEKNGRPPMQKDFVGNPEYPSQASVQRAFDGSWNNALKATGLEINRGSCTKDEIIVIIKKFSEENGREPVAKDFVSNRDWKYNILKSVIKEFGSWDEAKRAAGFDVVNSTTKARQCESQVFNSFKNSGAVDLAGENRSSPFDGLCPKGKLYDAKSSKLYMTGGVSFWKYVSTKKQLDEADYFFLGAYDENHKKLLFMWRVDRKFMRNRMYVNIGNNSTYEHNIINMKEYDITERFIENVTKEEVSNENIDDEKEDVK